MTLEEQRIAIAEACGWTFIERTAPTRGSLEPRFKGFMPSQKSSEDDLKYLLPDYLNDLNAMHEAEKVIDTFDWDSYCTYLSTFSHSLFHDRQLTHATASQRAEAFLKTIGKWKE